MSSIERRLIRFACSVMLLMAVAPAQSELLTALWTGPGEPPHCVPVPGDYFPNNGPELSVFCEDGVWHFYDRNDPVNYLGGFVVADPTVAQRPAPADYNGDGFIEPATFHNGAFRIYDAATGTLVKTVHTGPSILAFNLECQPVPGDYTGNGTVELATFCLDPTDPAYPPSFSIHLQNGTQLQTITATSAGGGQLPVDKRLIAMAVDWTGDGTDQPTVFMEGAWFLYDYAAGGHDTEFWTGPANSEPAPLDYDGDGIAEPTTFCHNDGVDCSQYVAAGVWNKFQYDYATGSASFDGGIWVGHGAPGEERPISARIQE